MKIGIAVGVVIAILALVVCLVPLKEVAYAVVITYYDNEPYEVTETYYETEPYEELQNITEPLDYQFLGSGYGTYIKLDGNDVCGPHFKIMNRAEVAGYFTLCCPLYIVAEDKYLDLQWEYPNGIPKEVRESEFTKLILEETLYLRPGEIGEAACSMEELIGKQCNEVRAGCDWEILPEEITKQEMVTKYRQVQRERTVTKYREVEREQTETRYKKVTLLDYLLHY